MPANLKYVRREPLCRASERRRVSDRAVGNMAEIKPAGRKHTMTQSIRFRVIAGLVGLAVAPFALATYLLFEVIKTNIEYRIGEGMSASARLLGAEVDAELEGLARLCGNVAEAAETGANGVELGIVGGGALLGERRLAEPGGGELAMTFNEEDQLVCLAPVKTGAVEVMLSTEDIFRHFRGYASVGKETAILLYGGRVVAFSGREKPPLPEMADTSVRWFTFEDRGKGYYASAVKAGTKAGMSAPLKLVLVSPGELFLADYQYMLSRSAFIIAGLLAALLALSWRMTGKILKPIAEIRHGAEIIARINLGHRIKVKTGDELEFLADDFNHMAESLQGAYGDLERRVYEVAGDLSDEKQRLSTILRTMAEGLVVANENGEVLLLNPRARAVLVDGPQSGIGLSLSKLLPGERLGFHMKRLLTARTRGREAAQAVTFELANGKTLRGLMTILEDHTWKPGFLLIFKDITEEADHEELSHRLLATLPAEMKGPVSSVNALVDILERRSDLERERQLVFLRAIREEAGNAATIIARAEGALPGVRYLRWPILPADPIELLEEAMSGENGGGIKILLPAEQPPPVAVEPFSWLKVLRTVLLWTHSRGAKDKPVEIAFEVEESIVVFTFRVEDRSTEDPQAIERLTIEMEGEKPLNILQALSRNRAELWTRRGEGVFETRLGVTRASALEETQVASEGDAGRPEFYDFDLFLPKPAVENEKLLHERLSEIEYVVFDTESTGLDISQGARLVSISGVRVRGGKVLAADTFDALVNPGMPIPPESTKVHKITDEMVAGAKTIAEILPKFKEWAGNAVLVAHNAAFDMRLLASEAALTGQTRPLNPVLDTLLLSYGVHKDIEGHSLDAICERFGVTVEGRHTSIGDAITTARLFVKFIPLMESRGIFNLSQAKSFCDRMLLLRWQSSRY